MGQSTSCFSANTAVPTKSSVQTEPRAAAAKAVACASQTRTIVTKDEQQAAIGAAGVAVSIQVKAEEIPSMTTGSSINMTSPSSFIKINTPNTSDGKTPMNIISPTEIETPQMDSLQPSHTDFSFPTFTPQITHSTSNASQVSASTEFGDDQKAKQKPKRKEVHRKKLIGGGVTGRIYSGLFGDCDCVIKSVPRKNVRAKGLFTREYKALNTLKHDNIVHVYGRSRDEENYYLILEKCEIDLADYRMNHRMKESQVKEVMRKLFKAIGFMHNRMYAHRDIKPENIVFRKGDATNPVLIDFGEALDLNKSEMYRNDLVGTPNYLSKERLLFDELSGEQFKKADVFALGVVCFELIAGVHCFNGNTNEDTYKTIISNKWEWPTTKDYHKPSQQCKDFVKSCLVPNYLARPTVAEALSHPWLNSN